MFSWGSHTQNAETLAESSHSFSHLHSPLLFSEGNSYESTEQPLFHGYCRYIPLLLTLFLIILNGGQRSTIFVAYSMLLEVCWGLLLMVTSHHHSPLVMVARATGGVYIIGLWRRGYWRGCDSSGLVVAVMGVVACGCGCCCCSCCLLGVDNSYQMLSAGWCFPVLGVSAPSCLGMSMVFFPLVFWQSGNCELWMLWFHVIPTAWQGCSHPGGIERRACFSSCHWVSIRLKKQFWLIQSYLYSCMSSWHCAIGR